MIDEAVKSAVASLPEPKAGEDGKSMTIEQIQPLIDQAVKALPPAAAGKSVTLEEVRPLIAEAVAALPPALPGKSVTVAELEPVVRAEVERAVKALPAPKDGAGVAGAMIDRDGRLQITLSNGEVKDLGVVVGKDGADFTDATIEYDGERTLTIRGRGGEITKRLPIPMDRGYYRDGMHCEKGDIVTHDGNAWVAQKDTKARPGQDVKEDWRLMVRKGRDGESVVRKVSTEPAPPIKLKD